MTACPFSCGIGNTNEEVRGNTGLAIAIQQRTTPSAELPRGTVALSGGLECAFDVFEVLGGGEFVMKRAEDAAIGVDDVGHAERVVDDR